MSGDGQVFDRLVDRAYLEASEAAWGYVRLRTAEVLEELGLWRLTGRTLPLDRLAAELGAAEDRAHALAWMLDALVPLGAVEIADGGGADAAGGDARRWTVKAAPGAEQRRDLLAAAEREAAAIGSSRPLFDYAAERYAAFLRGERGGPTILLKPPGLELWEAYFSAANPLYEIHNAAGAAGLERLAALPAGPRVLELGAGTGGGSAAVLAALERSAGEGAGLVVSDTSPSFLLRTVERLSPRAVTVERRRLDFNRSFEDQGVEAGSFDAVVAVNALHLAADLPAVLARVAETLTAEGALVISESLCGPGEQVHQEFVFNLLPGGGDPPGASRFFSAERWRSRLAASPFDHRLEWNRRGPQLGLLAVCRPRRRPR